ncbi:hypothetical protein StoSoilA2_07360 [Arthrobacter sp. StoSoilA2]|nr:hypothetical protein StoSoilA2_07360 [Arthrobacter sp. StoSoilA2]
MLAGRPHSRTVYGLMVLVVIVTGMGNHNVGAKIAHHDLNRLDHFIPMFGEAGVRKVVDMDFGGAHEIRA